MDIGVAVDKLMHMQVDELHSLMVESQVQGIPSDSQYCVVANWLRQETGIKNVYVCPTSVSAANTEYTTSEDFYSFVMSFDQFQYPRLMLSADRRKFVEEVEAMGGEL